MSTTTQSTMASLPVTVSRAGSNTSLHPCPLYVNPSPVYGSDVGSSPSTRRSSFIRNVFGSNGPCSKTFMARLGRAMKQGSPAGQTAGVKPKFATLMSRSIGWFGMQVNAVPWAYSSSRSLFK